MENSRGITLATLVVMIASIILFSTMAIGYGYRYLNETKETDQKYFKEVLSNAVSKREGNYQVNSLEYPRIGYSIKSVDVFRNIANKHVPELKSVNTELVFERGQWFIVDERTAGKLGVKGSDKYIDVLDEENEKMMTVTLVDYLSGVVYMFDINGAEVGNIKDNVSGDVIVPEDGHEHDYNIPAATCTEDRKCLRCGFVVEVALGHNYEGEKEATPIDDKFHYKKECTRCQMKGGYERHQDLDKYAFTKSGDEYYHYNGCSICGWPDDNRNYEKCTLLWKSISDTEHIKYCKVCDHEETYAHEFKYVCIDEVYHEEICSICGFVRTKYEPHAGERYCDKCGCEIIKSQNPILLEVLLKNKEYPASKYVTYGETIQLIFTADKMITDANVTICGYGGDSIRYTYSTDKLTCTAELYVDSDIVIPQNSEITFTIDCKSISTGMPLENVMSDTTKEDAYLIYDSIPPTMTYISKDSY